MDLPDSYVGSMESQTVEMYLFDDATKCMAKREVSYVPAFAKCFDEIIVNAMDQATRLKTDAEKGTKEGIKHVKNIKVNVDRESGVVTIYNDGDGIDVEMHPDHGTFVPEMIFGNLLTSANYGNEDERTVGGRNGVGIKLANIFGTELTVETVDHRRARSYKQRWSKNMTVRDAPTVKAAKAAPFTRITWTPDYARFGMTGGMTDDVFDLFRRRTMDAGACTDPTVAVWFNDAKVEYKDFERYVDLFIGNKTERVRSYEVCGIDGRKWEVVATYSDGGQFEHVSFVNGIYTMRGGKHVDYVVGQITKKMAELVQAKKKREVKPQHIKDNLWVFVKSTIVNPAFDSQTKETLTTIASKFGSKCELSDKFFTKLFTSGIADRATALTDFHEQDALKKKLVKTDGKKTSRIIVPKLDDANKAGTKDSAQCTLILTEGDSARSMAIAGLSEVGRDKYGVFPLRGKILNVKEAAAKAVADNAEITHLKKILGLEQNKDYKDVSSLRYGKVMIMTDQDTDGFHIRGLLFNVFQTLWPSLFKMEGFLTSMRTPIVKVTHPVHGTTSFYNLPDFHAWNAERTDGRWTIKYYKGLGTSTAIEAKEYFRSLNITEYKYDGEESEESMNLAFDKKRADDRKAWILGFDSRKTLDYTKPVTFSTFVNDELIHFSNRDVERNIPSLVDGMKESIRKIMFACFKKKLYSKEIRVAQLSGYVSEVAVYHHGEKSLQDAIVGMAQDFVGSNNINLLMPNGQFGTRIQGGDDAASPRYIHTMLSPLARLIFREEDNAVLTYKNDDDVSIEPTWYVPVIPMILVNGGLGIGTGFSTNVPCHNPSDVINMCATIIAMLDVAHAEGDEGADDLESAYATIDAAELEDIAPWYLGFIGAIERKQKKVGAEETYVSRGCWAWKDDATLEITELPVGVWTETYKEHLTKMIVDGSTLLKDFESHYTDKKACFTLKIFPGKREAVENVLCDVGSAGFKLEASKSLGVSNMHLFDAECAIHKYADTVDIVKAWAHVRLATYLKRKKHQLRTMEAEYRKVSAKVRFINDFIKGTVVIMNRKEDDVDAQLERLEYPRLGSVAAEAAVEVDADREATVAVAPSANYASANFRYLTNLPIRQLTTEQKAKLESEAATLKEAIDALTSMPIHRIWRKELSELHVAWDAHRAAIEKSYSDAPDANASGAGKKRRAAPKAAAARKK
jgi:DNA topoisomerase-2